MTRFNMQMPLPLLMLLLSLALSMPTLTNAAPITAPKTDAAPVEDFGVVGFRQDFFNTLTVTPYAQDKTIPGGAGHSLVTYTGNDSVFENDLVERGVEFVAYRIHMNDNQVTPDAYFPAIRGCRYAKVVKVVDGKQLVVDFEYNGGNTNTPQTSHEVSGYFFIDCSKQLAEMVQAADRPETFIFAADKTYVSKGMPNISFTAASQSKDMQWISSDSSRRATIKISAEDAIAWSDATSISKIPSGGFFNLDAHDHSIYLDRINIVGPTYTPPTVQPQWPATIFTFANGQCARTLEIRRCNTFAERDAIAAKDHEVPIGANWLAPGITGIVQGGGKRGDRGDGVIDLVGFQRFNLLDSTWAAWCVHSIKNNDGAGNWITIDGQRTDENGMPVNFVHEAIYAKRNRFEDVSLSFHDYPGNGQRRGVHIISDDFSWPMVENQYWTGGTSTSSTEPTRINVDGFTLYFGNNGDWRRELADPSAYDGIVDAGNAKLFDRIPKSGDEIITMKNEDGSWRIWGWGVQVGDVLSADGHAFEIANRKRTYGSNVPHANDSATPISGNAHFWDVTFKGIAPAGNHAKLTVSKSQTAYLLDGKPRSVEIVYDRDLHGHWQYNRAEVNYEYANICFNGRLRQTAGPADSRQREYQGLWELPVKQAWINCWAMDSDGSTRGEPADSIPCEAFNKSVLQLRNQHADSQTRDHHILVDGGRLFVQRRYDHMSPIHLRNRPQLIYGSASFGEPRLCNPVLLDDKGIDATTKGVSFSLVGRNVLDLSNSTFGRDGINVYGNGTIILNKVQFERFLWNNKTYSAGITTRLANGLQKDTFNLHLRGSNGSCGFRLMGEPVDASIQLTNWTVIQMPYTNEPFELSKGWQAVPNIESKIKIEGEFIQAVEPDSPPASP